MKKKEFRQTLPYGRWQCAGEVEVLFNRDYQPIRRRYADGRIEVPDAKEWIDWKTQEYFYTDANPPDRNRATRLRCERILNEWIPSKGDALLFAESMHTRRTP